MAGDGDANGALRIEQPQAREVRVELVEHLRSAPGFACGSGALQSLDGFSQLAPGLGNLLVGGLLGVEVDARASAAVGSRSMIGGASPELHDNADEGSGESEGSGAGIENEIGQDLGEQAEGPLDMGFVLRSRGRRADAEGVAESEVDFGGVIGGTVVEQQREGGWPVVMTPSWKASTTAAASSSRRTQAPVKAPVYA